MPDRPTTRSGTRGPEADPPRWSLAGPGRSGRRSIVSGKTPLYFTLLGAVLLGGAVILIQPYSADFPGTAYAGPVRRYLQAAIRQDSVGLRRLSSSVEPVTWALNAARVRPDSLAAWAGQPNAWTGVHRGDTTYVLVFPAGP